MVVLASLILSQPLASQYISSRFLWLVQGRGRLLDLNSVRIRRVREEDFQQIVEIEKSAFPNPYPVGYLRFLAKGSRSTFLVAEDDSGIAGFIIADVRRRGEGHIVSIAVKERVRRRGIAKRLMEAATSELRERGAKFIKLEVRSTNLPAINLYHSLGFRDVGVIYGYYRDGEDAISMIADMDDLEGST